MRFRAKYEILPRRLLGVFFHFGDRGPQSIDSFEPDRIPVYGWPGSSFIDLTKSCCTAQFSLNRINNLARLCNTL